MAIQGRLSSAWRVLHGVTWRTGPRPSWIAICMAAERTAGVQDDRDGEGTQPILFECYPAALWAQRAWKKDYDPAVPWGAHLSPRINLPRNSLRMASARVSSPLSTPVQLQP